MYLLHLLCSHQLSEDFLQCGNYFRWFQTELARDMGYAAARFGHVMFPENVYEPALECAELLLGGVGKGMSAFSL